MLYKRKSWIVSCINENRKRAGYENVARIAESNEITADAMVKYVKNYVGL